MIKLCSRLQHWSEVDLRVRRKAERKKNRWLRGWRMDQRVKIQKEILPETYCEMMEKGRSVEAPLKSIKEFLVGEWNEREEKCVLCCKNTINPETNLVIYTNASLSLCAFSFFSARRSDSSLNRLLNLFLRETWRRWMKQRCNREIYECWKDCSRRHENKNLLRRINLKADLGNFAKASLTWFN